MQKTYDIAVGGHRLAASTDGRRIAVATDRSILLVIDRLAPVGLELPEPAYDVRFSADGAKLLAAPYVIDLGTLRIEAGPADFVLPVLLKTLHMLDCAFTPDGAELIVLGETGDASMLERGILARFGHRRGPIDHRRLPTTCRRVTVGDEWIVAGGSALLALGRRTRRAAPFPTAADDLDVLGLTLNLTDHRLATAGANGCVNLFLDTGSKWSHAARFKAHDGAVTSVAFHPFVDYLATAGADGTVKLWTIDGTLRSTRQLGAPVHAVLFPTGIGLLYAATDTSVTAFRIEGSRRLRSMAGVTHVR